MTNFNLNTEFQGKRVIVTGASKGLGAALCEALANKGAKIAMLSRSLDKMNNLKKKIKEFVKSYFNKIKFAQQQTN